MTAALATLVVAGLALENATRLVHRHACYGADADDTALDSIGCFEPAAQPLEHMLTPDMLRCNTTHCTDRFGAPVNLHSLNCTESKCVVTLFCSDRLSDITQATVVGMIGVIALIVHNAISSSARQRATLQKNL